MARTARTVMSASRLLVVLSGLLLVLSLLPARAIRWTPALSEPLMILIAPLQDLLGAGLRWVAGDARDAAGETPEIAELRRRVDEYKFMWLNERGENERLRRQIAELQKGPALNTDVMRPVYAPVIGGGADLSEGLIKAKAGEREGVIPNSVAVVEGVHLVGRVTRVEPRYCFILPITQKAKDARALKGVIMIGDERGPFCDLVRTDGDVLNGRVFFDEGAPRPELKKGMLVRLDDKEWPAGAQMLILGEIIDITPLPQQPNRPVVTVKPKYALDRIAEVVIRIPMEAPQGAGNP